METTTLLLSGLTCAACQKLIQKRILRIDGVQDASVELTGETIISEAFLRIKAERKIASDEVVDVLKDTKYKVEKSS